MLQIKNTLGGGKPEGLYAWKKSKKQISYESTYVSNATHANFEPTIKSYPFTVYKSKGYTFDETTGEYTLTEPVSETIVSSGNGIIDGTYYGTINSKSSKNMIYPTNSGYGATIELTLHGLNAWTGTSTYPAYWYKSSKIIEFLDETYIVSDKENAYPDGGEKGGYWYEKVSVIDLVKIGCTKFEEGSFTPSSDTYVYNATHSLGVIPKFAIVYGGIISGKYVNWEVFSITTAGSAYGVWVNSGGNGCNYSSYSATFTSSKAELKVNTNGILKSGIEYHYLLLA